MSETSTVPVPKWFKTVGIVALVWNLLGLMAFVMQVTMSDAALAELPENQQELYNSMPSWVNVAFAVAVICGTLGCILLLARKKLALPVFIASLIGVLAQNYYNFFASNAVEVMGAGAAAMPVMVIVIAILLICLTVNARTKGWLL